MQAFYTLSRTICGISLVLLIACAQAPELIGVNNPEKPVETISEATTEKIFIATSRKLSDQPGVFFSKSRSTELNLASVVVSVPPQHVSGEIERAMRLPPDPETEFAVIDPELFPSDEDFLSSVNAELKRRAAADRDILVFVHGYNTTLSDAVLRIGQFVHDTDFSGVPLLFSWASAGKVTDYVYDINSALSARRLLEQANDLLIRTNATGFNIFAHSMGNLLVVDTMVQLSLQKRINTTSSLKNIVLASPDIDIDLFKSQLSQMGDSAGNIFVLVSEDDAALAVSRRLAGGIDRVGDASAEELAQLGLTVIDLSEIDDSFSGSHSKFAGSPEVVQLLGRALKEGHYTSDPRPPILFETLQGVPVIRDLVPR